jgi:hypothetical protein
MKRTKILGLALVAVFAMSVVAVSVASAAAPEFKSASEECYKLAGKTGRYTTSACTTESAKLEGEFEKRPKLHKFKETEATSHFYAKGGIEVTCTKDTSEGEILGLKKVKDGAVTFTGCSAKEGTTTPVTCGSVKSPTQTAGTIVTTELSGELGTVAVAEAATEVGQDLKPSGVEFTTIELGSPCTTAASKVEGSVIGEATPKGTPQLTGELIFGCKTAKGTVQSNHRRMTRACYCLGVWGFDLPAFCEFQQMHGRSATWAANPFPVYKLCSQAGGKR